MCIYNYAGLSIKNKRNCNMDSLLLKEKVIAGKNVYLAAVCDGVGSLEDGAYASSAAVRMISEWFDSVEDTVRLGLRLRDKMLEINAEVVWSAKNCGLRTASTLSALLLDRTNYYIVHTGDSRIYRYSEGTLTQLTKDQVSDGRLTSCLGRKEKIDLFYNEGCCSSGVFLLCSDGLYKKMDSNYLQTELDRINRKRPRKTMEKLVQYVIRRGETDNISLALVMSES